MHPGAQEIVFVMDGKLIVEVEGDGARDVAAGGVALIPAETPHRVRNDSNEITARVLVTHSRADKQKPFSVVLKKSLYGARGTLRPRRLGLATDR